MRNVNCEVHPLMYTKLFLILGVSKCKALVNSLLLLIKVEMQRSRGNSLL